MHIAEFCINNPVKVAVGVILVWMFGLMALFSIPIQLTPEVTKPVITVFTRWPGASPEEVEKEIVSKQEEQLQGIEGITEFRSESNDSVGEIELEFAVGTDLDATLLKVGSKLDQVTEYPLDAEKPAVFTVGASSGNIAYLSLIPLPPGRSQLEALAERHPKLRAALARVLLSDPPDVTQVYALAAKHPEVRELLASDPDPIHLRRFARDKIAARIEEVAGVARAEVYGGQEEELRVIFNPPQLAARRITLSDLRRALVGENKDVSGGDLWEGKQRIKIRTLGRFTSPEQVAETIVAYRDGTPVYVRDVARVEVGFARPLGLAHQRGVNMLTIAVQRKDGSNVLEVMRGVKQRIAELNAGLLRSRSLQILQSYDETVYITSATQLVRDNIFVGGTLAVLVLLAFLRNTRATLIIALSIPISCIGTFLVVRLLGRSINVISLAGIAFAVGMVVDNAIVVLENIDTWYQRGYSPSEAASRGTGEVWGAILASTLTTQAVFLPVIFIQEEPGQLFRDIAIAICAGVGISLVVALTVIPAAAARLLSARQRHQQHEAALHPNAPRSDVPSPAATSAAERADDRLARWGWRFVEGVDAINHRLQAGTLGPRGLRATVALFAAGVLALVPWPWGATTLGASLRSPSFWSHLILAVGAALLFARNAHRVPRLAVVLMALAVSWGGSYRLMPSAEYLPEGNQNLVFGSLQPPPGYNLDQLMHLGETVEARLRPYWEARPGTPEAERLDGPPIDTFFLVAREGSVFMGARAFEADRAAEMVPVIQQATDNLPGVISFVSQASLFGRSISSGRTIDIQITGPELATLLDLGRRVLGDVERMYPKETETVVRPIPSLELGAPEMHIVRHAEKAAQRGIDNADLGFTVDALVDGAYVGNYWHEGNEIDLKVYGDDAFSRRTQDVAQLPLGTPSGEILRVGDVADVTLSSGPEQIYRVDRERAITVQVRPGPAVPLEEAMNRIEAEILTPLRASITGRGLYQFRLAGTADKLKQLRTAFSGSMLLALVITYLLIAALYESFVYAAIIMVSVPLAAVGGFAGLALLNGVVIQRLDSLTMLGFVILTGTVVNNAILIVDQALVLIRTEGWAHAPAAIASARGRIRPIFMTTLTTVLGMLPLVLFPGAGSELYRGLGAVILGGLLVSTIFTLFLVPLLFALVYESQQTVRNWWSGAGA